MVRATHQVLACLLKSVGSMVRPRLLGLLCSLVDRPFGQRLQVHLSSTTLVTLTLVGCMSGFGPVPPLPRATTQRELAATTGSAASGMTTRGPAAPEQDVIWRPA